MTARERHPDLNELRWPSVAQHWERHETEMPAAHLHRLERRPAASGTVARRRGERQRLTFQTPREVGRRAAGVDDLHELIAKLGVGDRLGGLRGAVGGHGLAGEL